MAAAVLLGPFPLALRLAVLPGHTGVFLVTNGKCGRGWCGVVCALVLP